MSEYKTTLRWQRNTPDFSYDGYERTHTLRYGSGPEMALTAAPEYRGVHGVVNPEELLVAALSSCHLLSFLAIAARKRLIVDFYTDDAVGRMSKNANGRLWVSHVQLQPHVVFAAPVSAEVLAALHHQAHAECFIANSVKTEIEVLQR